MQAAVDKVVEVFGGIDILVDDAGAISLTGTLDTELKRFDLMNQVNNVVHFFVPSCVFHILKRLKTLMWRSICRLRSKFGIKPVCTAPRLSMAEYGMSLCVLGIVGEFRDDGIAFNALWPKTIIYTANRMTDLQKREAITRSILRSNEVLPSSPPIKQNALPCASYLKRYT
ncbi:MAG: hypothetical protein PHO08_05345 [Methylococcales bacterium]|nr:hypothetical protein [Methylococcales bacterium]MDD5630492.1 hypothetical protein [Methylococcales bacterium]